MAVPDPLEQGGVVAWLVLAKTAASNSWARSMRGSCCSIQAAQAVATSVSATQENAACHKPRAHNASASVLSVARRAMILFSNA